MFQNANKSTLRKYFWCFNDSASINTFLLCFSARIDITLINIYTKKIVMKSEMDLYESPMVSVVVLQSQNSILLGSSDIESAGIQDYIEQPGLSW